jgi:hypothetical protein
MAAFIDWQALVELIPEHQVWERLAGAHHEAAAIGLLQADGLWHLQAALQRILCAAAHSLSARDLRGLHK